MTGIEIHTVLDSVMLLSAEELQEFCTDEEKTYIFYYTIRETLKQEKFVRYASEKLCMPVRRLGYKNSERGGPKDFVSLIKNALM